MRMHATPGPLPPDDRCAFAACPLFTGARSGARACMPVQKTRLLRLVRYDTKNSCASTPNVTVLPLSRTPSRAPGRSSCAALRPVRPRARARAPGCWHAGNITLCVVFYSGVRARRFRLACGAHGVSRSLPLYTTKLERWITGKTRSPGHPAADGVDPPGRALRGKASCAMRVYQPNWASPTPPIGSPYLHRIIASQNKVIPRVQWRPPPHAQEGAYQGNQATTPPASLRERTRTATYARPPRSDAYYAQTA